ncbi:tRNA (adenosine(37)-N6)-threonylcarbamoyltransferase complex dimerization subunit type 1 TsaB [Microbacterium lacus]|uniref:tRNA (adenosine(37)-N6)-threonylcarbamoyltransferase complex dimerization subunit type 1 TsaB n=1 Tax=Microbacterium lacus TaxID=415217 RepID=UPI00384BD8BC
MILGIDTSLGTAVGIVDVDGTVRADLASADTRGHAEVIGTLIQQALAEAGATPAEITHVAAGMGPGPFTGLRVGIAAARAFALGVGAQVIPVASHDAAAWVANDDPETPHVFAIVTDARRREEAFTVYGRGEFPVKIDGPSLRAAGTDIAIESVDLAGEAVGEVPRVDVRTISGAILARVAAHLLSQGEPVDAASEPLYLRAPDVTMPHGPKRVGT